MTTVVKIGGSLDLDNSGGLLRELALTAEPVVIVHGAHRALDDLAVRLGHPPRMVISERGEVARFTDSTTMDQFLMAYAGKVNKRMVEGLRRLGADPVGLTAMDGGIAVGRRRAAIRVVEGGRMKVLHGDHSGTIERVQPRLLRMLLGGGFLPVITPPAVSHDGWAINVDGDRLAAELAVALSAERLLIFSDTPGLLADPEDGSSLVGPIRAAQLDDLRGGVRGRAVVKVKAAAAALRRGVGAVGLVDGRGENPLHAALAGAGTWIRP